MEQTDGRPVLRATPTSTAASVMVSATDLWRRYGEGEAAVDAVAQCLDALKKNGVVVHIPRSAAARERLCARDSCGHLKGSGAKVNLRHARRIDAASKCALRATLTSYCDSSHGRRKP